ncbi:MAG: hypothetical protein AAFN42_21730 [Cyanobacteria bacterium J06554_1]
MLEKIDLLIRENQDYIVNIEKMPLLMGGYTDLLEGSFQESATPKKLNRKKTRVDEHA